MNILWISNIIFPNVCEKIGLPAPVVGGWMKAGADALIENSPWISLIIAAPYSGSELVYHKIDGISYYLFPSKSKRLNEYFRQIVDKEEPHIIHIHGTEYTHSLAFVDSCGIENVVVSIQGLVSIYAKYYKGGIDSLHPTFRDIIRNDSLKSQQLKMEERGKREKVLLGKIKFVIGRTSWDHAHVLAINPSVSYHFCNETLRSAFYQKSWKLECCERFTIFLSQAHYPIKGLHKVVEAISIVKKRFPNVKVFVAGNDIINKPFYKINGYGQFVRHLMNAYEVNENFEFLGLISENEMAERFEKSHIFICPSSIENSPNSVGEAQLIGVPTIGSYVGGTMDMITHNVTGLLYRFEEVEVLAYYICMLFENDTLCKELSENARLIASQRHDRITNSKKLISIYKSIFSQ